MSPQEAKLIIESLAKGIDPDSGEILPEQGLLHSPKIIRALFLAVDALDIGIKRDQQKRTQPNKAGRSWSVKEDESLLHMFDSGASIKEIVAKHERTKGAISSRLLRLGRLGTQSNNGTDEKVFETKLSLQFSEENNPTVHNAITDSEKGGNWASTSEGTATETHTEIGIENYSITLSSILENKTPKKPWGARWTDAEITNLSAWREIVDPHDVSSIRSFAGRFAPARTALAVLMQMEKQGLISTEMADSFSSQLELKSTVSDRLKKRQERNLAGTKDLNGQEVQKANFQIDLEVHPALVLRLPAKVSFKAFDALDRRVQDISSFLVQLGPIPKPNPIWIFGDGKSWGQMIEHTDAIKNHRNAIERVAKIFCVWVYECSELLSEPGWDELARQFELRMTACPEDIFQLLKIIRKQTDAEISKSLQDFIE
ncbi:MAG: hypothetical protein WCL28_14010 [bacterium]